MTAPKAAREKRLKKLDPKKPIQLYREADLPPEEDHGGVAIASIKTGVEKEEEEEHHLQLVLKMVYGDSKSRVPVSIPIPEAHPARADDAHMFPRSWRHPRTLVRFSQPVEDVIGCPYNMDERDDAWLAAYNAKVDSGALQAPKLSEDQFEEVMWGLERMLADKHAQEPGAAARAPAQSSYPTLRELHAYMDAASARLPSSRQPARLETLKDAAQPVLEWWSARRAERGGLPIQPQLRMEDTGANDPYVCFRRREARPLRKTRRADGGALERIRLLRDQMRRALDLADMVAKREKLRREAVQLDELVFRQRVLVRAMRKKLGLPVIGEAEQALERPRKRARREGPAAPAAPAAPQPRADEAARLAEQAPERLAEQRVAKQREEDERNGVWDRWMDECVVVDRLQRAADAVGWRRDAAVEGAVGLPGAEQAVPRTPEADPMDEDVPAPPRVAARMPASRLRVGRGGRVLVDRRARLRDVVAAASAAYGVAGKTRPGWRPGDYAARGLRLAPEDRERGLEDLWARRRWEEDEDEEEDGSEDEGVEYETTAELALFRASIMRDAPEMQTRPRHLQQYQPLLGPAPPRAPLGALPPPVQVMRPPGATVQQQQLLKGAQRRSAARDSPGPGAAAGPGGVQAAPGAPGAVAAPGTPKPGGPKGGARPGIKAEPPVDPKQATVKMLMKESAKGAQQIQQITSELQRQQQMRLQQAQQAQQGGAPVPVQQAGSGTIAVPGGFQGALQYAVPTSLPGGVIGTSAAAAGAIVAALPSPTLPAASVVPATTATAMQGRQQAQFPGQPLQFQVANGQANGVPSPTLQNAAAAAAMMGAGQLNPQQAAFARQIQAIQQLQANAASAAAGMAANGQPARRPNGVVAAAAQGQAAAAQAAAAMPAGYQYLLQNLNPNLNGFRVANGANGQAVKIPVAVNGAAGIGASLQAALGMSPGRGVGGAQVLNGIQGLSPQQLQLLNANPAFIHQLIQKQQFLAQQNAAGVGADGAQMEVDEKGQ